MTPTPYVLALLGLAAFRCWWLLARDTITLPLRDKTMRWRWLDDWLDCPFCSGAWTAFAWWASWYFASPKWTTVAAVPFALSAVVGVGGALVAGLLDE